jgi:hypothetical protein
MSNIIFSWIGLFVYLVIYIFLCKNILKTIRNSNSFDVIAKGVISLIGFLVLLIIVIVFKTQGKL